MHHYFEAITNTDGKSLIGYFARVIDPATQNTVTLSADDNGTPIVTVSGVPNMASTDAFGNLDFYVNPGTYHLDLYAPNASTFIFRVPNVAMNSTKGDKGDQGDQGEPGPADNTYSSYAAMQASDPTRKSARLVGDTDVPPHPDGPYNNPTQTIGGWVPQTAQGVSFNPALTGTIIRDAESKMRDMVSVKDFGAKGNGNTNDTAAINAAIDTGRSIFLPTGVYPYLPSGKQLAFGQSFYGENPLTTRIAAVDNGDMFSAAAGCGMYNIGFQGNGGPVNARCLIIPGNTSNITLHNVNMLDFRNYCVEIIAANGGSQLRVIGGLYARTDPNTCAFKLPDADTQASPRQFAGVASTGFLIDTAGADNTMLTGVYCRNMINGAGSKKTLIAGSRFGTIEGDFTVAGIDHAIVGNAMAGRIVLAPGTQTSFVKANVNVLGAVDNSGNNTNQTDFAYYGSKTYDPQSLPAGGTDTTTVSCPGARVGMFAQVTFSSDLFGMDMFAYIAASDSVTVRFVNSTGGPVDLPAATLRVVARQL